MCSRILLDSAVTILTSILSPVLCLSPLPSLLNTIWAEALDTWGSPVLWAVVSPLAQALRQAVQRNRQVSAVAQAVRLCRLLAVVWLWALAEVPQPWWAQA